MSSIKRKLPVALAGAVAIALATESAPAWGGSYFGDPTPGDRTTRSPIVHTLPTLPIVRHTPIAPITAINRITLIDRLCAPLTRRHRTGYTARTITIRPGPVITAQARSAMVAAFPAPTTTPISSSGRAQLASASALSFL